MKRIQIDFGQPNPIQQEANDLFRQGKRIVVIVSGRQAGKSHYGARWLVSQIQDPSSTIKLAAAVAPTFRMARVMERKIDEVLQLDSRLWKRIKKRKQPIPTYQFPNGWTIEVHSSDDPDSLRGPTFEVVWYDEVAKGSRESFDIIMPTLLAAKGRFLGTTTPRGKQNWIYENLYVRALDDTHPEHDPDLFRAEYGAVVGSTWDNVDNLSEEAIEQLEHQYGAESRFGRQEVGGEFVSYEGLVYEWEEENYLPYNSLPDIDSCSVVVGGIDFGWTDPSVAVVMGYKDGAWHVYDAFFETHVLPNDFATQVAVLTQQYRITNWYADSARPDAIAEMRVRGLPVMPVIKPEIEDRIKEMAIFANGNRLKVSYRAPDVRNELQTYQYPDEARQKPGKRLLPIDANNHTMDAIGYVIWSMRYLWRNDPTARRRDPESLNDDEEDPYERLARKSQKPTTTNPAGLYGR